MPRIALFDSGVGGLSILPAIEHSIPHTQVIYLADHKAAPYGNKSPLWLNTHIIELINDLEKHHKLDIIIIACNTASTICLDSLRAITSTPIIGVVPAVKTAAQLSQNQSIGILATPATIDGQYLQNLITNFAPQYTVTKVGSTELVTMAEQKLSGRAIDREILRRIILPFIDARCDTVVLGCTHFPHLLEELTTLAPQIQWIDSANAIAKRCTSVLKALNLLPLSTQTLPAIEHQSIFYSTARIHLDLKVTLETMGFKQTKTFTHKGAS